MSKEILSKPVSKAVGIYRKTVHSMESEVSVPFYASQYKYLKSIKKEKFQILVMMFGELMWINVPEEKVTYC